MADLEPKEFYCDVLSDLAHQWASCGTNVEELQRVALTQAIVLVEEHQLPPMEAAKIALEVITRIDHAQ